MSRKVMRIGIPFFALVMLIALGLVAARPSSAAPAGSVMAQACQLPPAVDGSAEPTTVMPGQSIRFTVWNFRAGEQASFWFTTPSGDVFGTAEPLCCVAPDGYIRFAPVPIPQEFGSEPGRWAFTVQGQASGHTSVVYFCVSTTAQPTPVPPTNTAVPPTATSVPATATSVPATATTEATAQATAPPPTTEATAQPTLEATAQPTSPPAATVEATAVATSPPVPEATAIPEATAMPTPEIIGMPRTGEPLPIAALALAMLSSLLVAAGLAIYRRGSFYSK